MSHVSLSRSSLQDTLVVPSAPQRPLCVCETDERLSPQEIDQDGGMVAQENLHDSLLAVGHHLELAMDVVRKCRAAHGKLGPSLSPDYLIEDLRSLWNQLETMIHQLGEENSQEARNKQQSLISSAKRISGQVFVLPMSMSLEDGFNPKRAKVILEYGLATTTFHGHTFNGKYSRILLEIQATEMPKLSLSYKKRWSFGSRSKIPLATARTVQISYSTKEECFEVIVLFGSDEHNVGRATFHVEWYPRVPC